ncbi:hypothetical protein [Thiolapillus sp.]|uniref:hypothetical protein n=1 Tax=Thiolapillus sp. TaxID=2017437 RepID=UPI003AF761FB
MLLLANAAIIAILFIFSPLYGGIKKPPHIAYRAAVFFPAVFRLAFQRVFFALII